MTDSSSQLRRRFLAGAAAVALLVVGILVGALITDDDGDGGDTVASQDSTTTSGDETSTTTSTTAAVPIEGATPEAQELIDLIDRGLQATYTVRYATNDPASGFGAFEVSVWRDGDLLRQDATITAQGRTVESAAFLRDGVVRACQRGTGGPDWTCRDVPPEQAPNVDDRIREAVSGLANTVTGGTPTTIAGRAARCYALTDSDGVPVELCVTEEGVPARFNSGESSVELLSYVEGVPDGIFEPPA